MLLKGFVFRGFQAASVEDGEEGIKFMREMRELSKVKFRWFFKIQINRLTKSI